MTRSGRDDFRAELLSRVPERYSPLLHLTLPTALGLALAAASLASLSALHPAQLLLVPLFLVVANAAEWAVHKHILHRRIRGLEFLYRRHTPQHHAVYVPEALAIRSAREVRLVLLPAFSVVGLQLAQLGIGLLLARLGSPSAGALWVATASLYLIAYEWLHLACHLPEESAVGRLRLVRALRHHHGIHHAPALMHDWNFNVTAPLWDVIRRTEWRERSAASPPALAHF